MADSPLPLYLPISPSPASWPASKTIVYWNDGKTEIGRLGEANRINIPFDQMPVSLRRAVLAAEDREFYGDHGGFDPAAPRPRSLERRARWRHPGRFHHHSAVREERIPEPRTDPVRKARELVLSVKLETESSKDEILGDYLNTIYFCPWRLRNRNRIPGLLRQARQQADPANRQRLQRSSRRKWLRTQIPTKTSCKLATSTSSTAWSKGVGSRAEAKLKYPKFQKAKSAKNHLAWHQRLPPGVRSARWFVADTAKTT